MRYFVLLCPFLHLFHGECFEGRMYQGCPECRNDTASELARGLKECCGEEEEKDASLNRTPTGGGTHRPTPSNRGRQKARGQGAATVSKRPERPARQGRKETAPLQEAARQKRPPKRSARTDTSEEVSTTDASTEADEDASAGALGGPLAPLASRQENGMCPICLDPVELATSTMTCVHTFCKRCLATWLAQDSSCPVCRAPVTTIAITDQEGVSSEISIQKTKQPVSKFENQNNHNLFNLIIIFYCIYIHSLGELSLLGEHARFR